MLQVPSTQLTPGPAWNTIVTSAAITNSSNYNPNTGVVANYINQFTVGHTIWVVSAVNAPAAGEVLTKWYTNGNLYQSLTTKGVINAHTSMTASFSMVYHQPAEGKVEIYWADTRGQNAQLAVTLLFVVQPES